MHHIYHTEAIILSSKNYGETGKYYALFTRDLGLIYASAQGVRKMSSKLRFVLRDFSYVKVDLVRGKEFWRITSAGKTNKLEEIGGDKEKLEILCNIFNLLKRLLAGEETNEKLFEMVLQGALFLEKTRKENIEIVETIIVFKIMNILGYMEDATKSNLFRKTEFDEILLDYVKENKKKILTEINRALKETHL